MGMTNWLRNKLHNFIFPPPEPESKMVVRETTEADIEGMRFTVMPAEGGTIVQMRIYDRRKDESNNKTYVIPDTEEDIAHRIGQIIALELLRA
jgi:hypothetical protein